ncbi:unnamed protein product [Arabidopsis halleri]
MMNKPERDFEGFRFLVNSGNWFLVIDSCSNLYIIDVFGKNLIDLLPLESLQCSDNCTTLERLGDKKFIRTITYQGTTYTTLVTDVLKGDDHYTYIPLLSGVFWWLQNICDVVLRGHSLYILSNRDYIRFIDFSGSRGFRDVTWSKPLAPSTPCEHQANCNIISDNSSGELLLVQNILNKIAIGKQSKTFRVFKKDPNPYPNQYYIEVNSLVDEALLLGLRITVPGIEPNYIYFISHDSPCYRLRKTSIMDICVFNLATKTLKRFPSLSNMKLKVARWFLPVPPAT